MEDLANHLMFNEHEGTSRDMHYDIYIIEPKPKQASTALYTESIFNISHGGKQDIFLELSVLAELFSVQVPAACSTIIQCGWCGLVTYTGIV